MKSHTAWERKHIQHITVHYQTPIYTRSRVETVLNNHLINTKSKTGMKVAATAKWSVVPLPSSPSAPENTEFQMKTAEKRRVP